MAGKKGGETATGNATMQLDAVVDDMEEVGAPDLAHRMSAPPPLPPKKAGAGAWLTGAAVVLVAAGAAVGIGMVLRALRPPSPIVPAAAAEEPEVSEPGVSAAEASEEDEGSQEDEAAPRVQLDEIVFDSESEGESEGESESDGESDGESEGESESDGE